MFSTAIHVVLFGIFQAAFVLAEFQCLCSYDVEVSVYSKASTAGDVIGYLYEFDCKPLYGQVVKDSKFKQVQFEHQVGYVENTLGIQIQSCQGAIPPGDLVIKTTSRTLTATTTTTPTTIRPSTTRFTTTPPATLPPRTTVRAITAHAAPAPSCPRSWSNIWAMHGSSCYLFHTNDRKNWTDANNDCVRNKAHLAIIETAEEFNFVKRQLGYKINTNIDNHPDTSVWLAGRDNRKEGSWEWYDGTKNVYKPITYKHWGNNEPNAGHGWQEEDCLSMVGNIDFTWADYSCSEHMFYVCEQSSYALTAIVG